MSYGHDKDFVVKDSGKRIDYQSGMRRDTQEGKPNYRLIDLGFLKRLAIHLTKGAEKYGRDNWRLANSKEELDRFQDSAFRHLMQWLNGETDEDHGMAVAFNIMAAEHTKEKMAEIMPKKKPAVPPYSDEKEGVNIYSFLRTLNDAVPGQPIITFAIDFDYDWLTIYIDWRKFRLSRKIDLIMFRHVYTEATLVRWMVEDICHNYQDAIKSQKGDKDEHPV